MRILPLIPVLLLVVELHAQSDAAPAKDMCPVIIDIDAHGHMYENRFHGRYRVSMNTLLMDVRGGCKVTGPVSSVTIAADKAVPYGTVQTLMQRIREVLPASTPLSMRTP